MQALFIKSVEYFKIEISTELEMALIDNFLASCRIID